LKNEKEVKAKEISELKETLNKNIEEQKEAAEKQDQLIKSLESEKKELEDSTDKIKKNYEEQIANLKSEKIGLEQELEQIQGAYEDYEDLQKQVKAIENLVHYNVQVSSNLKAIRDNSLTIDEEIKQLTNPSSASTSVIDESEVTLKKDPEEISEISNNNVSIDFDEGNSLIKELEQHIDQVKSTRDDRIKSLENELEALVSTHQSTLEMINKFESKQQELENQIAQSNQEKSQLEIQISEMKKNNKSNGNGNSNSKMEKEIKALKEELNDTIEEKKFLKIKVTELENKVQEIENEISELIDETESHVQMSQGQMSALLDQLTDILA